MGYSYCGEIRHFSSIPQDFEGDDIGAFAGALDWSYSLPNALPNLVSVQAS